MLNLILTNDWELFGDGTGDYFSLQHKPLEILLEKLADSPVKLTLMAEVCQQITHRAFANDSNGLGEITDAWDEIVKKSVINGHDAQLHLHPQWLGARRENGKWLLNMNRWALSSLPPEEIENLIRQGKSYLEDLLKSVETDYICSCFRAGAYCLQPEKNVLAAFRKCGINCDTSVTKGYKLTGFFDFRNAHSNLIPYYTNRDNICEASQTDKDLLEMPIYSVEGYESKVMAKFLPKMNDLLKYGVVPNEQDLEWQKERERVKNKLYPRQARFYKKYDKKNLKWYMSAMLSKGAQQLDYDFLPPVVFVKMLTKILENKAFAKYWDKGISLPVVATGHIKDMHNSDNLMRILDLIGKKLPGKVGYSTLSKEAKKWREILTGN